MNCCRRFICLYLYLKYKFTLPSFKNRISTALYQFTHDESIYNNKSTCQVNAFISIMAKTLETSYNCAFCLWLVIYAKNCRKLNKKIVVPPYLSHLICISSIHNMHQFNSISFLIKFQYLLLITTTIRIKVVRIYWEPAA